jgi:hypothetical protein
MRKPIVDKVARFWQREYLRLILQAAEGGAKDNTVEIALESVPSRALVAFGAAGPQALACV